MAPMATQARRRNCAKEIGACFTLSAVLIGTVVAALARLDSNLGFEAMRLTIGVTCGAGAVEVGNGWVVLAVSQGFEIPGATSLNTPIATNPTIAYRRIATRTSGLRNIREALTAPAKIRTDWMKKDSSVVVFIGHSPRDACR
jgi:hypothetical protein